MLVRRTRAGDRPRYSAPNPLAATMLRPVVQNCATVARPSAGLPRVSMTVLMHSNGMETSTDAAPAVAPAIAKQVGSSSLETAELDIDPASQRFTYIFASACDKSLFASTCRPRSTVLSIQGGMVRGTIKPMEKGLDNLDA
jgi:hypothetical protein